MNAKEAKIDLMLEDLEQAVGGSVTLVHEPTASVGTINTYENQKNIILAEMQQLAEPAIADKTLSAKMTDLHSRQDTISRQKQELLQKNIQQTIQICNQIITVINEITETQRNFHKG